MIDLAADAGFRSIGIRLCSPMAGGPGVAVAGRLGATAGNAWPAERPRLSVFDIEVVRLAEATDVETYVAAFETAAVLGAHRATVNIDDPDRSHTVDRFGRLCDLAAPHRSSLDIEFMIWRPVARLEDAVSIVTAAARRNGHVLVDALHLDRSGGTPAAVAAVDAALIGCVQAGRCIEGATGVFRDHR